MSLVPRDTHFAGSRKGKENNRIEKKKVFFSIELVHRIRGCLLNTFEQL